MTAFNPYILIVDRDSFRVTLYKRSNLLSGKYKRVLKVPCAVGSEGHTTPGGMYEITHKTRKPDWRKPNSEWVPKAERGKVVPFRLANGQPNPENPFKSGFISIYDGVGLHDTKFDPQIGTRASHGCIRLTTEDLDKLFARVKVGTPIYIF